MQESPIFIKSYETMIWVLERTKNFPKDQRFVMAKRIEEAILTFYDEIVYASRIRKNTKKLFEADYHLERLRASNRNNNNPDNRNNNNGFRCANDFLS
jgi:formylglycine-generating enzyme required for sulfatase activity